MSVEVARVRKAVEISWDTGGGGETEPNPPEGFPEHPWVDPEGPRPEHPIYLPDYIWGGGNEPFPGTGLPGDQPEVGEPEFPTPPIEIPPDLEEGLSEEQKEKLRAFLEGNLPPYEGGPEFPQPVGSGGNAVQVFAQGQDGDWSNTPVMPNDGLAVLTYPDGFSGESYVEVRALDGTLVDSGTIQVEGE